MSRKTALATVGLATAVARAATGASHCGVPFAQKGGLLYAQFALSDTTGALTGTITGGNGSTAHANGTLTGQEISGKGVKITLHYTM